MRLRMGVGVVVVALLGVLLAVPGAHGAVGRGGVDCARVKCIALTYDDGPAAVSTGQLLEHLRARGAKATFFMVGAQVVKYPGVARRVAAEGHEIANHTYGHKDLRKLTAAGVRREVLNSAGAIFQATGKRPVLVRPPYGAMNAKVRANLRAPIILWSVDTRDWADRNARVVAQRVLAQARPGAIVLMHDIHASTAAAAPAIIDGLRRQGYHLVTVSELYAGRGLQPGTTYSRR